jgi:hypothetical protein
MQMNSILKFGAEQKVGSISLVLSITEMLVVWGAFAFTLLHGPNHMVQRASEAAWLVGIFVTPIFGLLALIVDRERYVGLMALGTALCVFLLCGLANLS